MKTGAFLALAAVAIVVVLAFAFLGSGPAGPSSFTATGGGAQTSTLQGENQTYIATYVATLSTQTTKSSSTTVGSSTASSSTTTSSAYSSPTSSQSQGGGDSYTYSQSSQVRVLGVSATVSGGAVGFSVSYENIGTAPIYVLGGGGSSLEVTVTSGGGLIKEVQSPRCEIAAAMVPLDPGSSAKSVAPGCWSGYYYQLMGPGTITVQLTLTWSSSVGAAGGSVQIEAEFALA